mgnify:CR=1 FL=1
MGLTPRERVLMALNHQEADRIPIDFGAMRSTGISVNAYMRLREKLGIKDGQVKLYDLMQWLAEPELPILERLHGDVIQLHRYSPAFGLDIGAWREWTTPDGHEVLVPHGFDPVLMPDGSRVVMEGDTVIARMTKDGHWFDQEYHPLANATTYSDIDNHNFPTLSDEEYEFLCSEAKRLHDETDYAVLAAFGGNIFEAGHFDFGYQNFMTMLAGNPDLALYYMDKLADSVIAQLERWLPAVRDYVQIIQVGDDLGMQTGPQISPKMYREMIKPFHARIYKYIKENSDLFIFLHSCGSIYSLLPDLIEIGVDIINPVQYQAADMDPVGLKREFGQHLTFWGGGCDTQHILSHGTIEEIKQETERMVSILAPGGGFVFTQVHNILREVDPERVIALYDTAYLHGWYR